MTQLIYLRKRLKDAAFVLESVTAERERFAKSNWLSRTAWERLGYEVRKGEASNIELDYMTPRGTQTYMAYHAGQVELRPGVWRKMLRHLTHAPDDRSLEKRAHRAEVHAALIALGQDRLASRLLPSLLTEHKFDEDRAHLDGLDNQIEMAQQSLSAVRSEYEAAWFPIVNKRRTAMMRRELLRNLADLGVADSGLTSDASVAELKELLRRKQAEVQRANDLDELTRLGVDVATLAADLSPIALRCLVQRRRRQTEPLRMSRVMRMNGIDPDSLPESVDPRAVIDLLEGDGYLATVPSDLNANERLGDLVSRSKVLAACACEQYPSHVTEAPCHGSPGRIKLMFRKPPRREQPRSRSAGRSRRCEERAWVAAKMPWQEVGF